MGLGSLFHCLCQVKIAWPDVGIIVIINKQIKINKARKTKREKDQKNMLLPPLLKQISLLKLTFPGVTKWIIQWWRKKGCSLKHYHKPETILGLTFPAAESDEKQIKVKVNAFPHLLLRIKFDCIAIGTKTCYQQQNKDLLTQSKLIIKSINVVAFLIFFVLTLCNFAVFYWRN